MNMPTPPQTVTVPLVATIILLQSLRTQIDVSPLF